MTAYVNGVRRTVYAKRCTDYSLRYGLRRTEYVGNRSVVFEYLESRVADHLVIRVRRVPRRRKVAAREDRVARPQGQRLHRAQVRLAAARDPDVAARVHEPE